MELNLGIQSISKKPIVDDDCYCFIVGCYDQPAALTRRYELYFFTKDNAIELYEPKNKCLFLQRHQVENVHLWDLYIGNTINVFSRQLKIVDYIDEHTLRQLRVVQQWTLGLIKPDAYCQLGHILNKVWKSGLKIVNMKSFQLNREQATELYRDQQSSGGFNELVTFMSSGPVLAFELLGEDAVSRWLKLLGPTDPEQARLCEPNTVRALFGTNCVKNAGHGSATVEEGLREINLFFPPEGSMLQNTACFTTDVAHCIINPHIVLDGVMYSFFQVIWGNKTRMAKGQYKDFQHLSQKGNIISKIQICKDDLVNSVSVTAKQMTLETQVDESKAIDLQMILKLLKEQESRPLKDLCFSDYGKARLVLQYGKYFVESNQPDALKMLVCDPVIQECRMRPEAVEENLCISNKVSSNMSLPGTSRREEGMTENERISDLLQSLDKDEDDELDTNVASYEINQTHLERFLTRCQELDMPLMVEYDFRNDTVNQKVNLDLESNATLQPYQEKSFVDLPCDVVLADNNADAKDEQPLGGEDTSVKVSSSKKIMFVVDSNMLLDDWARYVVKLKAWMQEQSSSDSLILLVPWAVLQELDKLKDYQVHSVEKTCVIKNKAQNAVEIIYKWLSHKDRYVKCESPIDAAKTQIRSVFPIERKDDKILLCVLECKERYSDFIVVLLTNDKNVTNKATILGIRAFKREDLNNWLQQIYPDFKPIPIVSDRQSTEPQQSAAISSASGSSTTANKPIIKSNVAEGEKPKKLKIEKTCARTTKQRDQFGAIPGVEVGTIWKFRAQMSEAGIHRPHKASIWGNEDEGAYSIVVYGDYEDDQDNGDNLTYTGSGGYGLSSSKRAPEKSCDQTLTHMNLALARNCNATLDAKKGAEAKDWRAGKPVRVIRNCKGRKYSQYPPEEGNRYDGIYKVVKYWVDKGQAGFQIWKYLLCRDDPAPAPWTQEGKERIQQMGLTMQIPEDEGPNMKKSENEDENLDKSDVSRGTKRIGKRRWEKAENEDESEKESSSSSSSPIAKRPKTSYENEIEAKKPPRPANPLLPSASMSEKKTAGNAFPVNPLKANLAKTEDPKEVSEYPSASYATHEQYVDLQREVTQLRASLEQAKKSQDKRFRDLMAEIDEEKKVHLNLQVEVERLKKMVAGQ